MKLSQKLGPPELGQCLLVGTKPMAAQSSVYQSQAAAKISAQGTVPLSLGRSLPSLCVGEAVFGQDLHLGCRKGCGSSCPHPGPEPISSPRGPAGGAGLGTGGQGWWPQGPGG